MNNKIDDVMGTNKKLKAENQVLKKKYDRNRSAFTLVVFVLGSTVVTFIGVSIAALPILPAAVVGGCVGTAAATLTYYATALPKSAPTSLTM